MKAKRLWILAVCTVLGAALWLLIGMPAQGVARSAGSSDLPREEAERMPGIRSSAENGDSNKQSLSPSRALTTFSDSTFLPQDWEHVDKEKLNSAPLTYQLQSLPPNPSITYTIDCNPPAMSGDPMVKIEQTFGLSNNPGPSQIQTAHLRLSNGLPVYYDPGNPGNSLEIKTVNYRFSYMRIDGIANSPAFAIVVEQGGNYFRGPLHFVDQSHNWEWQCVSKSVTPQQFIYLRDYGVPSSPNDPTLDLSCSGAPVRYGYLTGYTDVNGGATSVNHAVFDDLFIEFVEESCQPGTCMTLQAQQTTCVPGKVGWSGCYDVTFIMQNNSGVTASDVLLADPWQPARISPNVVPLFREPSGQAGLPNGQTSKPITFTYCPPSGTSGTQGVYVTLSQIGGAPAACCQQWLEFDLPVCPSTGACTDVMWMPKGQATCVPGAQPGTYNLSFDYMNMSSDKASLYLLVTSPQKISPQFMGVLDPGVLYTVPLSDPLTIKGIPPNATQFCVAFSQTPYDPLGPKAPPDGCCSRAVCFDVPDC